MTPSDIPINIAVILWDSGLHGGEPAFAVRALGHRDYDEFSGSVGACFTEWRSWGTQRQQLQLLIEIWQIASHYLVPPAIMEPELLRIPEYRAMLATDCLPREYRERDGRY